MVDFDERDLIRLAEAAGFDDIKLELASTFREAMHAALTPDEQDRLTQVLRPRVKEGRGTTRFARAFLTARKPKNR